MQQSMVLKESIILPKKQGISKLKSKWLAYLQQVQTALFHQIMQCIMPHLQTYQALFQNTILAVP